MDFPETDPDGAPRIFAEQVIRGDVCRYLELCDDGTVHTSKGLTAHRKDQQGDWWNRHLNPITDQVSGRVATYLVRPCRQDPPSEPLVFGLDVAGTRYTGDGPGWLLAGFEPGRYRAVGQAPVPGRAEYLATEILAWARPTPLPSITRTSPDNTAPRRPRNGCNSYPTPDPADLDVADCLSSYLEESP